MAWRFSDLNRGSLPGFLILLPKGTGFSKTGTQAKPAPQVVFFVVSTFPLGTTTATAINKT